MLVVDVEKKLGDFTLKVSFTGEGRVTALYGPSGAGKTTIINLIAGLARPDRGRIVLEGDLLFDTGSPDDVLMWFGDILFDSNRRIDVPAWQRQVGCVFQEGRLFPHLSVERNLDYGRWMNGHKADLKAFAHVVELLDLGHLLARRPGKLSGGERQRVAVGRALLTRPHLLLLDEPLASLDAARKQEILPYLQRLRDETKLPMVYVSHDAAEVKALASHVVMLDEGRVIATGGTELLSA